ncbi:MAG: DNA repair protein RecN [Candidatus Dormibacteria bacterium]
MIRELSIRNLALVDHLLGSVGPGLNLLTGETGSGKSIIVDSLGLALGEKGNPEQVRTGAETAAVDAVFEVDEVDIVAQLRELGHEPEDGLVRLGRELGRNSRGNSRVNGRLVSQATLRSVGALLVDVHGQREHQALLQDDRLLAALDAHGGPSTGVLAAAVAEGHAVVGELRVEVSRLARDDESVRRELELLAFQLDEIRAAAPVHGEDVDLEQERATLAHAERLREAATLLVAALDNDDTRAGAAAGVDLGRARAAILAQSDHDPRLKTLEVQLEGVLVEIEDLRRGTVAYLESLQVDPARLDMVQERLERLRYLKSRYGGSLDLVLGHAERASTRLEEGLRRDELLELRRAELATAEGALATAAAALSKARSAVAASVSRRVEAEVAELNMPRARFNIVLGRLPSDDGMVVDGERVECRSSGVDRPRLLLAANPGEPELPLERVGSGGEISRLMLALRTVLGGSDRVPTVVLDEVDAGIGGETAVRLGTKLKSMAAERQVICVTHLAAVAALADRHLVVRKHLRQGRNVVEVATVDGAEAVAELARLLAGDRGGEPALATARGLLSGGQADKAKG